MKEQSLPSGDVVEVKSPAKIIGTLDERRMLDGLPFTPEMLRCYGRQFVVSKRAEKVCIYQARNPWNRVAGACVVSCSPCCGRCLSRRLRRTAIPTHQEAYADEILDADLRYAWQRQSSALSGDS